MFEGVNVTPRRSWFRRRVGPKATTVGTPSSVACALDIRERRHPGAEHGVRLGVARS